MGTTKAKKTTKRRTTASSKEHIPNSQKPPKNKYTEAALKHQGSFIVYDSNFMLPESTSQVQTKDENMDAITEIPKKMTQKIWRTLNKEQKRAYIATMPVGNKTFEAARRNLGQLTVNDPNFML